MRRCCRSPGRERSAVSCPLMLRGISDTNSRSPAAPDRPPREPRPCCSRAAPSARRAVIGDLFRARAHDEVEGGRTDALVRMPICARGRADTKRSREDTASTTASHDQKMARRRSPRGLSRLSRRRSPRWIRELPTEGVLGPRRACQLSATMRHSLPARRGSHRCVHPHTALGP